MPSANDLLMGGGVKSAKFDTIGTTVGGRIVRPPQAKQQTDFDTGKPKFYDDGEPMMQIIVHVQTQLRDPADPIDDGIRALYVRGQIMGVVRDAVKAVGAPGLEVGGELYLTFTATEPNSRGRGQDKKVYAARYVLPSSANDALMAAQPAAPAPAAQQQYAPGFAPQPPFQAPAPALPPLPPPAAPAAQIQPCPAGVDPAAWAALSDEQRAQYLAVLAGRTA